jgi:hypothetical protein
MDKTNKLFPDASAERRWQNLGVGNTGSPQKIYVTDKRVARLLLVLQELDESVAGLEELPKTELSELVSNAILACGFVDPIEARYAIAAVLDAIGMHDSMPGSS